MIGTLLIPHVTEERLAEKVHHHHSKVMRIADSQETSRDEMLASKDA